MLTNEIQLKPVWEKRYTFTRAFVFLMFGIFSIFLAHRIIFPSEFYTYSFDHPNTEDNSIINVSKSNNNLIFDTIAREDFSVINIDFKLKKGSEPFSKNSSISAEKSYLAFLYPQGEDITNPNDFEINLLVSEGVSVYIIGNGKKYPINNPETFLAHGFEWEDVESSENIDLSTFEKQKLFNIKSPHPTGTVFKIKNKEKYFFIKEGRKHELKGEALKKPGLKEKSIPIEENIDIPEICQLSKKTFSKQSYTCTMKIQEASELLGNNYRFNLSNFSEELKINDINVEFKRDINLRNIKLSLKDIRSKIILRYNIGQ